MAVESTLTVLLARVEDGRNLGKRTECRMHTSSDLHPAEYLGPFLREWSGMLFMIIAEGRDKEEGFSVFHLDSPVVVILSMFYLHMLKSAILSGLYSAHRPRPPETRT
jgi:hypothetical protein